MLVFVSGKVGRCLLPCEPINLGLVGINFYFWACAMRFLISHCEFWTLDTGAISRSWANKHGLPNQHHSMWWQLLQWKLKVMDGYKSSGISSKWEIFLRTAPRHQVVDLHWLWAHVFASGGGSENFWNQAKHSALFAKLSCAMWTERLLFSRDIAILKCTNRNFRPSLQILPCLE